MNNSIFLNMKLVKEDGTYQEWRGLVKEKKWTDKGSANAVYEAWDNAKSACEI